MIRLSKNNVLFRGIGINLTSPFSSNVGLRTPVFFCSYFRSLGKDCVSLKSLVKDHLKVNIQSGEHSSVSNLKYQNK